MKVASLLPLAFTLLPLALNAQTHCTVQSAPSAPTPADLAYAHGDFAAAQTLYAAQVAASPTPQAYRGLVHSQLQLDLLPDAAKSAAAAAAASPTSGDARALNGEVLLREGQIPEATRAFSAALAADPCSPLAHFDNARIALILSRGSIATQELTTAHRLAPSDPEITAAWADTLPAPQRAGYAQDPARLQSHPAAGAAHQNRHHPRNHRAGQILHRRPLHPRRSHHVSAHDQRNLSPQLGAQGRRQLRRTPLARDRHQRLRHRAQRA